MDIQKIKNIRDLRKTNYKVRNVRAELRENLIRKIESSEDIFPGIIGYDDTIIPDLQNAILSKHDFILLGLRGQAKSRILRSLVNLLDDYIPIIEGSEINDHPFEPISKYGRELVQKHGDDTPIQWITRDQRYSEKLVDA